MYLSQFFGLIEKLGRGDDQALNGGSGICYVFGLHHFDQSGAIKFAVFGKIELGLLDGGEVDFKA